MKYSSLISLNNLKLAWRRVSTSGNISYKQFFRPVYLAYELAVDENLNFLHKKLQGSWEPTKPIRVYIPKPSGLQRPITLLPLEDQIVLQCIANIFSKKLYERRKKVEYKIVFSNILNSPDDNIFFLEDWHKTYSQFQNKCEEHFKNGYRWIAHFDFAAYYDTISHSLLLKLVAPRSQNNEPWLTIQKWLRCWSTPDGVKEVDHGIPQGPIAADFLAESFLLPLDEAFMKQGMNYVRYVDDIRIFAKSEIEAQRAAVELEVFCKNLGLIPQGKKYAISKAEKLDDALGLLPSFEPQDTHPYDEPPSMSLDESEHFFQEAIGGRPLRITNKSKARYVLFRAPASRKILNCVIRLLPRHPEHTDAFVSYMRNFSKSIPAEKQIIKIIKAGTPYGYVRGELYHVIARMGSIGALEQLTPFARHDLKQKNGCLVLQWGAISLLLACQKNNICKASKRIKNQLALTQALLVPIIPESEYSQKGVVRGILSRQEFEPAIVIVEKLFMKNQTLKDYDLKLRDCNPVVQNVLKAIGIIGRRYSRKVDQISDILNCQFCVSKTYAWRKLLGNEYMHALKILVQAKAVYLAGPSNWLQLQNSFNDAILKSLLTYLNTKGINGGRNIYNRQSELIDFGVLLDPKSDFSMHYPNVANVFRDMCQWECNSVPEMGTKSVPPW